MPLQNLVHAAGIIDFCEVGKLTVEGGTSGLSLDAGTRAGQTVWKRFGFNSLYIIIQRYTMFI